LGFLVGGGGWVFGHEEKRSPKRSDQKKATKKEHQKGKKTKSRKPKGKCTAVEKKGVI